MFRLLSYLFSLHIFQANRGSHAGKSLRNIVLKREQHVEDHVSCFNVNGSMFSVWNCGRVGNFASATRERKTQLALWKIEYEWSLGWCMQLGLPSSNKQYVATLLAIRRFPNFFIVFHTFYNSLSTTRHNLDRVHNIKCCYFILLYHFTATLHVRIYSEPL